MLRRLGLSAGPELRLGRLRAHQRLRVLSSMTEPPLYTRDFVRALFAHFLQGFGFTSMLTLPLYLDYLGADRAELGWIMSVASLGSLSLRPVIAWALDTVGRRPVLLIGTILVSSGMAMFGFVDRIGPFVYVVRILLGIGIGSLFTAYFTMAADLVPEARRTEGLAIFGVSSLLGLLINPIVGALDLEPASLRLVFPVLSVGVVASLFLVWRIPERARREGETAPTWREILPSLRQARLWSIWFATFVFSGMVAMTTAFAAVAAEHRGIESPSSIWITYTLGAVGVRIFGGKLPDRVGPEKLIPPAFVAYGLASWLFGVGQSGGAFLLAGGLAGLAHGYCFPVLTSQLVSRMPDSQRGSAMAMFTAIWELTVLIGPPMFGQIADVHGDPAMFAVAAAISVGCIVIWAPLEWRRDRVQ